MTRTLWREHLTALVRLGRIDYTTARRGLTHAEWMGARR